MYGMSRNEEILLKRLLDSPYQFKGISVGSYDYLRIRHSDVNAFCVHLDKPCETQKASWYHDSLRL